MDKKPNEQNDAQNNHTSEVNANDLLDELRRKRGKADEGREPRFLSGRLGTRFHSQAALLERIVASFEDEHGIDTPSLNEAETESQKMKLVRDTAEYVLAVESVDLSLEEKAELIRRTYAELFTYGALDALLSDETITTILLEGADKVSVRRGQGELESLNPIFDDEGHLRRVLRRILKDAGTEINPEQPIIEVGLTAYNRKIAFNIALPPVTFQINVDVRLHPVVLPTLDDLVEQGIMARSAAQLLEAIVRSQHGFIIVGDTESGKTTLMSILAQYVDSGETRVVSVERAGELVLPANAEQFVVQWGRENYPQQSFGDQILSVLKKIPHFLILDEVRADEPHSIQPLLRTDDSSNVLRQAWVFRGTADSKRLVSALGMVARRADPENGETAVRKLYEALPFVITLRRSQERIQLRGIAEWQFSNNAEYPDYVELMAHGWDGVEFTGKLPSHSLPLPDDFWKS
ncbi:MAG: ATPase, T2SS/T4P/T4SS family [Aggregatilineales bacterium]